MRAQATLDGAAQQPVTTTALRKFAAKPASGYGSKVAAIAATVCVPWLRGSRLPTARSASWNRRAICSERSQPFRAQNRRQAAFAVLFRNGGRGGMDHRFSRKPLILPQNTRFSFSVLVQFDVPFTRWSCQLLGRNSYGSVSSSGTRTLPWLDTTLGQNGAPPPHQRSMLPIPLPRL